MKSSIEKVAVIGTGVIGTGWIIRFLFNKKKILTNLFRLIGIIRYIFYKKTKS